MGGIAGSDGEVQHIQIGPEKRPDVPNGLPPAQTASGGREGGRGAAAARGGASPGLPCV